MKKDKVEILKKWKDKSCHMALVKVNGKNPPFAITVGDITDNQFTVQERVERLIQGRCTSPNINKE